MTGCERKDEDKTTHELALDTLRAHRELMQVLVAHIADEPKTIRAAIDGAIDRLVPDGDAEGHKNYHQSIIDAVNARKRAAEAEEAFWTGLRHDAIKGGLLGLGKVLLIGFGLWIVFRIDYKGPLPW